MNHLFQLWCRRAALLGALAGACQFFGGSALAAQPAAGHEVWLAASNKTLDGMRGGFDFGAGLLVSFGVARSISVNGSLIVTTSFNIPNLSMITAQQAALVTQQLGALNLIQNGPGNTVQSATTSTTSTTPTLPTTSTTSTTSTVSLGSSPAGVPLPNTVTLGTATLTIAPISGAALGTFIQNTLDNQKIQNQTVINASTNALGMLKGMNFLNTLNGALANALAGH
jgi:hypothetical protein